MDVLESSNLFIKDNPFEAIKIKKSYFRNKSLTWQIRKFLIYYIYWYSILFYIFRDKGDFNYGKITIFKIEY